MTTKFTALLHAVLLLLLVAGCDQGPLMKCDYCKELRQGVERYVCDKCTKPHAACDSEKHILHYKETKDRSGYLYYSATGILTCPALPEEGGAAEPVVTPVTEKAPAIESPEDPKTFTASQRAALAMLLVVVSLFLGYGLGKARHGQLIKLENKKGDDRKD
jgi:hypothetical protein